MNSNKKYFLFPKPRLALLLFLGYFLSSMVKQYILKDMKEQKNLSIPIFKLYGYVIADFLSLIPYLIIKKATKSKNNLKPIRTFKGSFKFISTDIFARMKKRIILNIFIISLLNFIAQISTITFFLTEENQEMKVKHPFLNIILIFNIIFLYLLTKFIMDISFHLYHYLSFIIFILCLIVIVIFDLKEIFVEKNDFINKLLYIIIRIFVALLYSIENVISKIIFLKYYISPYFLLLLRAIAKFFFIIIFSIPLLFIKFKDQYGEKKIIFSMFKDIFDNWIGILFYIIYFINSFAYNILNYFIIDKFSSTHTAIAYIFEYFGIFIIYTIIDAKKIDYKFGIRLVMYILLIFATLIYNEFLVINICGLANGTKLFLDYKEKNDLSQIKDINFDINGNECEDIDEENNRHSLVNEKIYNIELIEYL